jgi:two-component system CheB/CheR fusion protein
MSEQEEPFLIVGIGASAGGLAVLKDFVRYLPEQIGMAFIIIQHLDPTHKSLLSELLARESPLPVQHAENGQLVEPDHIYVIPPDTYLELKNGSIKLTKPKVVRGSRKAIDHFFRSLALECIDRCAGIILSGSGSDGTAGLRAIKAAGGLAIAQDPKLAEHSGMPLSAIEAGVIDKVMPVKDMITLLRQYAEHPFTLQRQEDQAEMEMEETLQEIANLLKVHEDFDLRQYKPTTVQRRIARRMSLTATERYADYLEKIRNSEKERQLLTKDLLINVTDFFRDPEAFKVIEKKVIPDILGNLDKNEEIRIWVAGCASGEEAYSIAILLLEAINKVRLTNGIKIFATDIDEHAIAIARKGVYPESIASEIPKKYLDKYFTEINNIQHYRIKSQVRDLISFASQNVAVDPPFNHMHLITCRNLLIYLKPEVQEKVLSSFYFSLEGSSYLFLGSSETIGSRKQLFKSLSQKWRIYQKIPGHNEKQVLLQHLFIDAGKSTRKNLRYQYPKRKVLPSRSELMRRALLENTLPPGVIVDQDGQILYNHGDWSAFIATSSGEPRNEIVQLVVPALRSQLRSGLFKIQRKKQVYSFHSTIMPDDPDKQKRFVWVEMVPLKNQTFVEGLAVAIIFREEQLSADQKNDLTQADQTSADQSLEAELAETREELQNTIEELETTGEELRASHEEALSTNEELQSANEELEASSEELRSLNEELNVVNAQLKEKIEELQNTTNDVENFFASTNIPTIFLNPDLKIQRYTPAAEQLLKMGPRDIGRPIYSIGRDLVDDDLTEECTKVLQDFQPIRKELKAYNGRWFTRRVSPYRTEDRRIEGVVIVFQDVTEIKELSHRAESREQQQAVVARLGMLALSGAEPEELMQQVVRQIAYTLDADYCKILKYEPERKEFLLIAGIGWQEGLVDKARIPAGQDSQAGFTLLSQQPVIVRDLNKEKRFHGPDILIDHKVISGISCVINHAEPPFGVIGVHTKIYREFTEDDANFLLSMANMLSTALRTRKTQKELEESQERLSMARTAARIGIHDHDIATGKVKWDEVVREIWGVPEDMEPITYEIFNQGLHPEDRKPTQQAIEEALNGRRNGELVVQYRVINQSDQKLRWVEATGKTVFENGRALRMVGTVQDITERKEAEKSLFKAVRELQETDRKKNEFLSILGHELRNPLTPIKAGVQLLEKNPAEPGKILKIMNHSVGTMARLLDDLLDLNRISQNKVHLDLQTVDICENLERALASTEHQYKKKNLHLETNIGRNLMVKGDPTRLEQVFSNLIINACKYTPDDGIIVLTASQNLGEIEVKIEDSGVGVDRDLLEKIFLPFFQVKQEGQAASGLGVGLALAKKLVELHHGTITAYSPGPNQGTTFTVLLPAYSEGALKPESLPMNTQPNLKAGMKIVLIEDNEDILSMMSDLMASIRCELRTARNGIEGLRVAQAFQPDAMVIDLGLPDISGHEVAAKLRADGYAGLLIALSGYSHKESREKSMEVGFDYHLAKPAALEDITDILAELD